MLAGAYILIDSSHLVSEETPVVYLVASGAVLPEVLKASRELLDEGVAATVVDVTSRNRLFSAWQTELRRSSEHPQSP